MNAARPPLADRLRDAELQLVTQHEDGSAEQLAERLRSFDRTVVFGAGRVLGRHRCARAGPERAGHRQAALPGSDRSDSRGPLGDRSIIGWTEYTMPQTILKLRQGFGRLIRTQTDRGVCVILDRRLISKRYGSQIVEPVTQRDARIRHNLANRHPQSHDSCDDGEAP